MVSREKRAETLLFTMWERSVHYVNGQFILEDEQGCRSVISKQEARKLQRDYLQYQVSQATGRIGMPLEQAYAMYGFEIVGYKDGCPQFDLTKYAADSVDEIEPSN